MSAPLAGKFQDHYVVLDIEPKSGTDVIHRAYTELARRFHPNNRETGDKEKYDAVTHAYEVLMDPAARAAFDSVRSGPQQEGPPKFAGVQFFQSVEKASKLRDCLLAILYDRRRRKPGTPGLSQRLLENMMLTTTADLQFAIWCLKQRGFVASDDKSNLEITFNGIESMERAMPDPQAVLGLIKPECVEEGGNGS